MGREFNIGTLKVELRRVMPSVAATALAFDHTIQEEIREMAEEAEAVRQKNAEDLRPIQEKLKAVKAGEIAEDEADEAIESTSRAIERARKAQGVNLQNTIKLTRKREGAAGLVIAAALREPKCKVEHPIELERGRLVLAWLQEEHGAEAPEIAALERLCRKHLGDCYAPAQGIDILEAVEISKNSEAREEPSTPSGPPTTGDTAPERATG